jgi:hypothetical protein
MRETGQAPEAVASADMWSNLLNELNNYFICALALNIAKIGLLCTPNNSVHKARTALSITVLNFLKTSNATKC